MSITSRLSRLADKAITALAPRDFDEESAHRFLAADHLADTDVHEPPTEYPHPRLSAPGDGSLRPVAAARPGPADPPPDAGPGHSTSDLLIAAANQLQVWRGTRWFRAVDATDDRELSGYRAGYLDELIPELRDRAAQFAAIND